MLERKERSGGEAAAAGGGAGPRAGAAARGLPAVRTTLQQCGLLQDLIDISLSNLRGLRTKCAASNDLTQQEIRTLEVRGSAAAMGPEGSPATAPRAPAPHGWGPRPAPSPGALSPRQRGPRALTGAWAVWRHRLPPSLPSPPSRGGVGVYVEGTAGRAPQRRCSPVRRGSVPSPAGLRGQAGRGRAPTQCPPRERRPAERGAGGGGQVRGSGCAGRWGRGPGRAWGAAGCQRAWRGAGAACAGAVAPRRPPRGPGPVAGLPVSL